MISCRTFILLLFLKKSDTYLVHLKDANSIQDYVGACMNEEEKAGNTEKEKLEDHKESGTHWQQKPQIHF